MDLNQNSLIHTKPTSIGHLDTGFGPGDSDIDSVLYPFPIRKPVIKGHLAHQKREPGLKTHGALTSAVMLRSFWNNTVGYKSVKVTSVSIEEDRNLLFNIIQGLDTLLNQDIKVLCMSIGITQQSSLFTRTIQALTKRNTLLVFPSGNKGEGTVLSPGI